MADHCTMPSKLNNEPHSTGFLEKLAVAKLEKKFPPFMELWLLQTSKCSVQEDLLPSEVLNRTRTGNLKLMK
jgi:hypothetical protein